jgi:hypothetical protein
VPRPLTYWLPAVFVAAALSGCGSPPQPLPTAPPEAHGVPSASGSIAPPLATAPTLPAAPVATPPTYPPLTYPTLTTSPTTPAPPTPSPAAKCKNGPTGAQVLAVVKGRPGIPDQDLDVHAGPYCSGSWQFTELEIAGKDDDEVEPLLVVTTGKPSALTVVETGADVCSDRVQDDAPPGIRVRACGF